MRNSLFIFLLLLCATLCADTRFRNDAQCTLRMSWDDARAVDKSPRAKDRTSTVTGDFVAKDDGLSGAAYAWATAGNYINVGAPLIEDYFQTSNNWTQIFWIRSPALVDALPFGNGGLFGPQPGNGFYIKFNNSEMFYWDEQNSGFIKPSNGWNFYAVRNTAGVANWFLNGKRSSNFIPNYWPPTNGNMMIGRATATGNNGNNSGDMQGPLYFSRALSDDEIFKWWNRGRMGKPFYR